MPRPNFLIIGAAKSGTTSLYRYLAQHPNIFMSQIKELNFFAFQRVSHDSDDMPNQDGQKRFESLRAAAVPDLATYHQQFTEATKYQAIGEASPMYLYSPYAVRRIYEYRQDMKLIAI